MLLGAALLACLNRPGNAAAAETDAARIRRTHEFRVVTDLSDPNDPMKLFFRSNGGYDGIEYQILLSFAQTLGAKLDVKIVKFDNFFDAVSRREGDVGTANLTETAERRQRVDLSDSYFAFRQIVIMRKGERARSFAELSGKRAITQKGTTWEKECQKVPKVKLAYTEGQRELFARVSEGTADFSVADSPMAVAYLESFPNLEIAWPLADKLNYVFALPKGSDLTPLLNAHIQKLKTSGAFYALLARFYGQKGLAILKASESPEAEGRPGH